MTATINDRASARKAEDSESMRAKTGHRQRAVRLPAGISRSSMNYAIDMTILASATLCAVTGIVKWPGLVYSLGLSYQGLPMETISLIHDWTGLLTGVMALAHVILHWRWLWKMTVKTLHAGRDDNEKA